jgi:hypothetical protein
MSVIDRTERLRARLSGSLRQIPDAFALLDEFILPGSAPAPGGARSAPSSSRPPVNLVVLDLQDVREKPDSDPQRTDYNLDRRAGARRQGVLPTLASWVRLVDGELWDEGLVHDAPADTPSVATECVWLSAHVDWILEQQWASEIADECSAILRDIQAAIGEHEVTAQRACFACGWDVTEMDGGNWFRCTGCPKTWSRLELHRMAERKKPKTLKQCAELIGVSVRTLRYARADRAFRPVARDGSTDLFDLQQVAASVQHLKYRRAS